VDVSLQWRGRREGDVYVLKQELILAEAEDAGINIRKPRRLIARIAIKAINVKTNLHNSTVV
jgi:hypothetical protein